jgi:hypothetical protein
MNWMIKKKIFFHYYVFISNFACVKKSIDNRSFKQNYKSIWWIILFWFDSGYAFVEGGRQMRSNKTYAESVVEIKSLRLCEHV